MASKTVETQEMLLEIADRLGQLQLKLKRAEGDEYDRLMKIAQEVRETLEDMTDIEDKEEYENKVKEAFDHTGSL